MKYAHGFVVFCVISSVICYIISMGPSTSEAPLWYPIHIKTYIANHIYDYLDIVLRIMFDIYLMGTTRNRKMLILPSSPLKANMIKTERPRHNAPKTWYPHFIRLTYVHYSDAGDGVSNLQPHDCILDHLFRHRSKKTSKVRVTGFVKGIHRWLVDSPNKGPVTWKQFQLDDSSQ